MFVFKNGFCAGTDDIFSLRNASPLRYALCQLLAYLHYKSLIGDTGWVYVEVFSGSAVNSEHYERDKTSRRKTGSKQYGEATLRLNTWRETGAVGDLLCWPYVPQGTKRIE